MASIRLKYVSGFTDRHGKRRWRFRRKGYPACYLPGEPGSKAFMEAYQLALEGRYVDGPVIGQSRSAPGSIAALIALYYGSTEWDNLAPSTKRTYRGILERFRAQHGHLGARTIQTRHIRAIHADMRDRPAAANNLLRLIHILMKHAVANGWRRDDPTVGVQPFRTRTEGFHPWSPAEIEAFKRAYKTGSRERLALALLLCTGQRGGDVAKLGPANVVTLPDGSAAISLRQQKTGAELRLPILPELAQEFAARKAEHLVFLATEYGRPFSVKGFQQWFAKRAKAATGNPRCTAHGLRKACAYRLAEAGCTPHQIQAITGHTSLKEVTRYTRAADQSRLAQSAFAMLPGDTEREQEMSNPRKRLDKTGSNQLKRKAK